NFSVVFRAIFSMNSFRKKVAELTCRSERGRALFHGTTGLYERKSFMVMQGLQNVIKDRKDVKTLYPMLILTGEFDIELAKETAEEWHAKTDNSEYFMIEDAGHCANIDNPDLFNRTLGNFLTGLNK
ncbi:MAG: alpha/beta hydrolase, partial [Acidobacteriota bacterium]